MLIQGLQAKACSSRCVTTPRRLVLAVAAACAMASTHSAAQDSGTAAAAFAESRLWASQIKDYANKSLNNEQALSVAGHSP